MKPISSIGDSIRAGETTTVAVAEECLAKIESTDIELAAFTHIETELLLGEAERIDLSIARGEDPGSLLGAFVGIKDIIDVEHLRTSYGSDAYEGYTAETDATSVRRIREAGGLIVGKTRTSEFVWGATTPPTRNPLNLEWVPGGSSGGSGASVGGGLVNVALGTDTGGSIRIPAALCGIVGLKPTFGLVSTAGVLPGHWLFDHVGPLATSVDDAEKMLRILAGPDLDDSATLIAHSKGQPLLHPVVGEQSGLKPLAGVRIGIADDRLFEILDSQLEDNWQAFQEIVTSCGGEIVEVDLPELKYVMATLLAVDLPGSAGIHTRTLISNGERVDPSIRVLLEFAHQIPGVLVERGYRARSVIRSVVAAEYANSDLDFLATPGLVAPPIKIGDEGTRFRTATGATESVLSAYVRPFALANVTGQPAVVIPTGSPIRPASVQLIGRPFEDFALCAVAKSLESIYSRRTLSTETG